MCNTEARPLPAERVRGAGLYLPQAPVTSPAPGGSCEDGVTVAELENLTLKCHS